MSYLDVVRRISTSNGNNTREILMNNAKDLFINHMQDSPSYKIIDINNCDGTNLKDISCVILSHTNPLNEDKQDRKLLVPYDTKVHRGSIITWNTENWVVMNDVAENDSNGIYLKAKILKCNNVITFKNKQGITTTYPIILTNQTLYSDGIEDNKFNTIMNDMRSVLVQYNQDTKDFYVQQRFIFNHNSVYHITLIDDYTYFYNINESDTKNGILKLTLKKEEIIPNDDKVNNLAYNKDNIDIPTPVPITSTYTIQITGSSTVKINNTQTYVAKVYKDGVEVTDKTVTFSLTNIGDSVTTFASLVSGSNNSCSIKGLKYVNKVKLTGTLSDDGNVKVSKNITVVNGW